MKGPKPLIEEHYHIQELIERQEKRSAERTYFQEKQKLGAERIKEIQEAKMMVAAEFLCLKCGDEFRGVAVRQVELPFNDVEIEFLKALAFKGTKGESAKSPSTKTVEAQSINLLSMHRTEL